MIMIFMSAIYIIVEAVKHDNICGLILIPISLLLIISIGCKTAIVIYKVLLV